MKGLRVNATNNNVSTTTIEERNNQMNNNINNNNVDININNQAAKSQTGVMSILRSFKEVLTGSMKNDKTLTANMLRQLGNYRNLVIRSNGYLNCYPSYVNHEVCTTCYPQAFGHNARTRVIVRYKGEQMLDTIVEVPATRMFPVYNIFAFFNEDMIILIDPINRSYTVQYDRGIDNGNLESIRFENC